ncbi:MAG: glycosyltransferase, partial [Acidimicrobiia bacterium]
MTDALSADRAAHPDPVLADDTPAHSGQVSVAVAVNVVAGIDPQPTLEAVARQAYPTASVTLVGQDDSGAPSGLVMSADLEDVVASLSSDIDYVWILHGDAEPRPDALSALVDEAERHEASLAGSKLLVAGTRDTLEGVGSATDIFGEPYSGLDEGEVDLEQYDVVRDVAFVSSVSMLVRRDLLRGLHGLDSALAPVAAGLDLSQRVRIAGGRVMVVPSSEVFHRRRCGRGDGGWREQAGRLRAMLKIYTPVTLSWMIPFALVVGVLDSLGSLLKGRWRLGPRYMAAWAWNVAHLPSTIRARRVVSRVRQVRDEELFRYQVRGSVRLRQVGSELSNSALAAFEDDTALTKRASQIWNSAGAWGLVLALLVVLVGVRSVFLGPLPVVGHSVPLLADGRTALARFLGGWNSAGLGSDVPVHPGAGLLALIQLVLVDNPQLTRSVVTVIAFGSAVAGTARLAGRLRIGGPGAYLGGVAAVFGPAAALLAGGGRWLALLAIGVLPWALSTVLGERKPGRLQGLAEIARTTQAVGL